MRFKTEEARRFEPYFDKAMDTIIQSGAPEAYKDAAAAAYDETVVEMSSRMTATAGLAFCKRNPLTGMVRDCLIRLSVPLMAAADEQEQFEICAHELAHIAKAMSGCRQNAHGPTWRSILKAMGGNGERCHAIDAPNPGAKPWDFFPGQEATYCGTRVTVVRPKTKRVQVMHKGRLCNIYPEYLVPVTDEAIAAAKKPTPPRRSRVNNPATIEGVPADEFCYRAAKKNGGTLSWAQIEVQHGLHKANGMTAYRLAQKYRKRAGL